MPDRRPPTPDAIHRALTDLVQPLQQLWNRIKRRFLQSELWKEAPPGILATEYLSLVRLAVSPQRVEAALLERRSQAVTVIAKTLPNRISPYPGVRLVGEDESLPSLPADSYFLSEGAAVSAWDEQLRSHTSEATYRGACEPYVKYLGNMLSHTEDVELTIREQEEAEFSVCGDPVASYTLRIISEDRISEQIPNLVTLLDSGEELPSLPQMLQRKRDLLRWTIARQTFLDYRNTSHHWFRELLFQMESDIGIVLGAQDPRETWLLILDETTRSLQFHLPEAKNRRIREVLGDDATVSSLVPDDVNRDDFTRYMEPCHAGVHRLAWSDSHRLSSAHVECLAEKFRGWPQDRGIVGTVIGSGCLDVVEDFEADYRVAAYDYGGSADRIVGDTADFYRARMAERVFIRIRPHLVEVPLLWYPPESHGEYPMCWGVFLALFDAANDDEFVRKAIGIRSVIEQWCFVFELQLRLLDFSRSISGNLIHRTRSILSSIWRFLPVAEKHEVQEHLDALWQAYAYMRDEPSLCSRVQPAGVIRALVEEAFALVDPRRSSALLTIWRSESKETSSLNVRVAPPVFKLAVATVLDDSAKIAMEAWDARQSSTDKPVLEFAIAGAHNGRSVILSVTHMCGSSSLRFLKQHRAQVGKTPIVTVSQSTEERRAHVGLYHVGALLRAFGGDLLEPHINEEEVQVTWRFMLPVESVNSRSEV